MFDVRYKIPSMAGETVHRRTYPTTSEAEEHRRDIAGYEGVTECYIERTVKQTPASE